MRNMIRVLAPGLLLLAAAGCEGQPISLLNLELGVDNTGYSVEIVRLASDMNVTMNLRVIQGDSVDVRLSPNNDHTSYKSAFSGDQVRERSASGVLTRGDYALRIRESSPRESAGVKKATVLVQVRGTPTRALRR
jgi:hypothetical protein